jgi:hypothetical protein
MYQQQVLAILKAHAFHVRVLCMNTACVDMLDSLDLRLSISRSLELVAPSECMPVFAADMTRRILHTAGTQEGKG